MHELFQAVVAMTSAPALVTGRPAETVNTCMSYAEHN